MKSKVFFSSMRASFKKNTLTKIKALLDETQIKDKISDKGLFRPEKQRIICRSD